MKTFLLLLLACASARGGAFTFTDVPWLGNLGAPAGAAGEDITTGLAAYWSFDSATVSGASVTDLSGNGNTATLSGVPPIVAGHRAEAVQVVATSSQYVTTADSSSLNLASNVTVACWIWLYAIPSQVPIVVGKLDEFKGYGLVMISGAFVGLFGYGANWVTSPSYAPTVGVWYHVATVYEQQAPAGGFISRLYVNGAEITPGAVGGGAMPSTGSGVLMGKHYNLDYYLFARLDDVRIYNRVLTPAQIAALAAL